MSRLFSEVVIRGVLFKNRIAMSPMCQYSSVDGMVSDWHLVHLGSRAVGGAGLIFTEASAVSPEGRISPDDLGIWNDKQAEKLERITTFIKSRDSVPGIQLAHAGRKASTYTPWKGHGMVSIENGGWETIAPSAVPFADNYTFPKEMNAEDIKSVTEQFRSAASRSIAAGFRVIELHMAHGYLVHQFLSPLSNKRTDKYGGNLENRSRLALEIVREVRTAIPEETVLFVRISSTDWVEGGWNIEESIQLARWFKEEGVDVIDCSSGGNALAAKIPVAPGYQVPFAETIKREASILTAAVGLITSSEQAEEIISSGKADFVLLARELLRHPYWPLHSSRKLKAEVEYFPEQYLRAK